MKNLSKMRKLVKRLIIGLPLSIVGFALAAYVIGPSSIPGTVHVSYIGLIPLVIGLGMGSLGLSILLTPTLKKLGL